MLKSFRDYINRYYKRVIDFSSLTGNPNYDIDQDRSTALRKVELNKKTAIMRIEFQKTPNKVYEYYFNIHHYDMIKEFFDSAVKNESRSWGKTFHLMLNLNWILPK
jgi:midasin (ATPase involved in ribosome maturation)